MNLLSSFALAVLTLSGGAAQTIQSSASVTADLANVSNRSPCETFGLSSNPRAASLCNAFRDAAATANWEPASQTAKILITGYPDNGIGYFCAGYVSLRRGQYIPAVRLLENAVDRAPEADVVHLNLALSYLALQQYKLFESEIQWLIRNRPAEPLPCYYLAVFYTDFLKQPERAVELFRDALRRNPTDYLSHYRLGSFAEQKGEIEEAKSQYEAAAAIVVSRKIASSLPLQGLARLHLRQGLSADAVRYARQAVSVEPNSASARLLLGKILLQAGEASSAINELKTAATLDKTIASPHYLLAQAYRRMAKPSESQAEQARFSELWAAYGNE